MLEKLKAINFQIHESKQLDLDQITFVTGPTDSGKSALIRALIWLCFNDVESSFIRDGQNEAKALLKVDGQTIKRTKDKSSNKYQIGRTEPHRAVGTKVPIEVSQLLNVIPDNFQQQHDDQFWFSMTPGQVAQELNQIVDLGVIDNCMKIHKKMQMKVSNELEAATVRKESAEVTMEEMKWGKRADTHMDRILNMQERLVAIKDELADLSELVEEIEGLQEQVSLTKVEISQSRRTVSHVSAIETKLEETLEDLDRIDGAIENVEENAVQIEHLKQERNEAISSIKSLQKKGCPLCRRPLKESQSLYPTYI